MFVYIIRFVDTCTHMYERTYSLCAKAEFIDMALNAISFLVILEYCFHVEETTHTKKLQKPDKHFMHF